MNKKRINNKLLFIISIAIILTTMLVGMAFAADLNAVTDRLDVTELVGVTIYKGQRMEVAYQEPYSRILKDGEAATYRFFTEQQFSEINNALEDARDCYTFDDWWNCGNHGRAWQILQDYGIFSIDQYSQYDSSPAFIASDTFTNMYNSFKQMTAEEFQQAYLITDNVTISTVLSYLNNTEADPIWCLKNMTGIYCARHGCAVPQHHAYIGDSGMADALNLYDGKFDVSTTFNPAYDTTSRTVGSGETTGHNNRQFDDHFDWDVLDGTKDGTDGAANPGEEPENDTSSEDPATTGIYPTQTASSNIKYFISSPEPDDLTAGFSTGFVQVPSTNRIAYALTFSEKRPGSQYVGHGYDYQWERCQNTIWIDFGSYVWTDYLQNLHTAARSVDALDDEIERHGSTPKASLINGSPDSVLSGVGIDDSAYEPTGTTIKLATRTDSSGSPTNVVVYRIGPFQMSDYAYVACSAAANYSGSRLKVNPALVGGIVYGEIKFDNGKVVPIGFNVEDPEGMTSEVPPALYEKKDCYKNVDINTANASHAMIVYAKDSDKGDCSRHAEDSGYTSANTYARGAAGRTASDVKAFGNYFETPTNYNYPWPKSKFYIEVPYSSVGSDAKYLTDINFDFRSTRAEGHGWIITGKYVSSQWKISNDGRCSESYTVGCGGYSCSHGSLGSVTMTRNIGGVQKGVSHTHSHTYTDGCGTAEKPCPGHTCTVTHDCSGQDYSYYTCTHCGGNCTNCHHGKWSCTSSQVALAQPFLAAHDSHVYVEITDVDTKIKVRLTTDVTIDKFITKVVHVGEPITKYDNATARAGKTDPVKKADPVKAERGDRITYDIVLKNKQDVDVRVQVKDILPKMCIFEEIRYKDGAVIPKTSLIKYDSTQNDGMPGTQVWFITPWVVVPKNGTKTLQIDIIATAPDSTDYNENRASLVSANKGRDIGSDGVTIDDKSTNFVRLTENLNAGAVVNKAELTQPPTKAEDIYKELYSCDYYRIKEYNIAVDKYIYDVNHNKGYPTIPNTLDTTMGATDDRQVSKIPGTTITEKEATKDKNPVYAEYGDTITYKIKLYNTTNSYHFFNSRTAEPYWEPDKVYIDVTDTLPEKYSDLTIEIDNQKDANVTNTVTINTSSYTGEAGKINFGSTPKKLEFKNIMVPSNGVTTITITLVVDEVEKGKKEINDAEHIFYNKEYIRNINYTSNHDQIEIRSAGKDKAKGSGYEKSKDVYIINNYNVFTDKYVYAYDEKIHDENNNGLGGNPNLKVTNESSVTTGVADITGNGKVLSVNRVNVNNTQGTNTDNPSYTRTIMDEPYRLAGNVDTNRRNYPVSVEQNEKIVYAIKVSNEAKTIDNEGVSTGKKPATQVRPEKVTDLIEHGLTFESVGAVVYKADGKARMTPSISVVTKNTSYVRYDSVEGVNRTYEVKEFSLSEQDLGTVLLDPGECIVYYVTVRVDETNMYLFNLDNTAELTRLTNINKSPEKDRYIFDKPYTGNPTRNENICEAYFSHEYVRMKDLVISGRVWLDVNRDGYINESTLPNKYQEYYGLDENALKKDVIVKLYKVTNGNAQMIRSTKTDEHGLYTFAKDRTRTFLTTGYNHTKYYYNATTNNNNGYQRIDKANNKDQYGNYRRTSSDYIDYYIEYEYDGVIYKSTEFYSNQSNLDNKTGALKDDKIASIGGKQVRKYEVDSNAYEFKDIREAFNTKYEYISYNVAYDLDMKNATYGDMINVNKLPEGDAFGVGENKNTGLLEFDKDGHTSIIRENSERIMTSRSFVKGKDLNQSIENTSLLWLFKYDKTNERGKEGNPKSEYTKFINLGLELREDVDISLTKDVYKIKTTINGEEMEYTYNLNDGINGRMTDSRYTKSTENNAPYLQDYIIKEPYGLEIYDSDYMFRFDQYQEKAVRDYKELKSELNIEVTYRMTIDNNQVSDDETIPGATETPLDVRVEEVLDIYDQNFIRYYEGIAPITVKHKDDNGFLIDYNIEIAEAWYYKEIKKLNPEQYKLLSATSGVNITNEDGIPADMKYAVFYPKDGSKTKGIYTQANDGAYVKIPLVVSNTSKKNNMQNDGNYNLAGGLTPVDASKGLAFSEREKYVTAYLDNMNQDGYNKNFSTRGSDASKREDVNLLYITGMGNEVIPEGGSLDIFVKYVMDKDRMEIHNENIRLDEISDITTETSLQMTDNGSSLYGKISYETINSTSTKFYLDRSLKIVEEALTQLDKRGIEGIAQVNAYSVWYPNGKPSSIVDKDSNAGNIGVSEDARDTGTLTGKMLNDSDRYLDTVKHVDDIGKYEDTAYRTGIELYAKGVKEDETTTTTTTYGSYTLEGAPVRQINGVVYDDSRSEKLGEDESHEDQYGGGSTIQYLGNGLYQSGDSKEFDAKMNQNVTLNYKDKTVTEDIDIPVRNAKVEFIEITKIPVNGETHYYESVKKNVTSTLIQNIRTDENGNYELIGLMPGQYIVRYTYGDTINEEEFNFVPYRREYASDVDAAKRNADRKQALVDLAARDMQVFNGQDYKSTQYNSVLDTELDNDKIIEKLEEDKLSDARDDEIRRLSTIAFSEVMTNEKAEILKGLANGTELTQTKVTNSVTNEEFDVQKASVNTPEQLKTLTDNTYMQAETVEFLVKPEKLTDDQMTGVNENGQQIVNSHGTVITNPDFIYQYYRNMFRDIINERNFKLEHLDFGIEYRPEAEISLIKEVNEVKVITQDNEVIIDLHLLTEYPTYGQKVRHRIDEENSIGLDALKFGTNQYSDNYILNEVLVPEERLQGFITYEIDPEILQGATIEITYKFEAENDSEVDRISKRLNALRYFNNAASQELKDKYQTLFGSTEDIRNIAKEEIANFRKYKYTQKGNYVGSRTAMNDIYERFYKLDGYNTEYRNSRKMFDTKLENSYYGSYTGIAYVKGTGAPLDLIKEKDIISTIKFNAILDYIDTNLTYNTVLSSSTETLNRLWKPITAAQLQYHVLTARRLMQNTFPDYDTKFTGYILGDGDDDLLARTNIYLTNIAGERYEDLVVSVDDRLSDLDEELRGFNSDGSKIEESPANDSLSRFLYPDLTIQKNPEAHGEEKYTPEGWTHRYANGTASTGIIYLPTQKINSAETDGMDLQFENLAEIIEFTTLTGRRTNFAITIGNVDMQEVENSHTPGSSTKFGGIGSVEFVTSTLEPDQAATEIVSFIPITGLLTQNMKIINTVEAAKTGLNYIVIIGAIAVIAILIARFGIMKYRKRRIK